MGGREIPQDKPDWQKKYLRNKPDWQKKYLGINLTGRRNTSGLSDWQNKFLRISLNGRKNTSGLV